MEAPYYTSLLSHVVLNGDRKFQTEIGSAGSNM